MNIERNYKKLSKHRYWKIVLEWWDFSDDGELEPSLKMYGFSSSKKPKLGFNDKNNGHRKIIFYITKSRDEALKKERNLLKYYFKYVLNRKKEIIISGNKEINEYTKECKIDLEKLKDNYKKDIEYLKNDYKENIEYIKEGNQANLDDLNESISDPIFKSIIREEKLKKIIK